MGKSESDHYKTLGLRRDASKAQVKAAFSRLALLHHPDCNDTDRHARADAATRRFRLAYDAYHVLYDDTRRAEYDLRTAPSPSSSAWSRFGYGGGKSRSSSASTSSGDRYGGASSSSSPDPVRHRYRHGGYQDWPSATRRGNESLGVWMKANWWPLLYCALRTVELVVDGCRKYNTWKSSRKESIEKEAAKSKEKMGDEPLEEEEYVVV
ncbi:chaperone protein dnaJ 72-like [Lolium rigidum]|uniref:chaperone protein dnaJ 72-like n=1 Tax=Lolium rigidum TaxID=89674 RepID=UPI001F5D909D|nr:chaperone protein dnaJ 72-like [Lolium rigidum]